MSHELNRRSVMKASAAATAGIGVLSVTGAASRKVRVGVMGLGRGLGHIRGLLGVKDVEIAYVCDPDKERIARGLSQVAKGQEKAPEGVTDFRRMLDDKSVDAITIAAPNFWHAPATILACEAGKHVYVEKPGSHNAKEAELMVKAARKYKRKVQMGNQRRSYDKVAEAVQRIKEGVIGKVYSGRSWYTNTRPSIGRGRKVAIPTNLDFKLWQGPVPNTNYINNLVHYNWHWRWNYGGGEMANNGVHSLDIVRWALGVDLPNKATYSGDRYHHDDDQETPDTGEAVFDFGHCTAIWSGSSCHRRSWEKTPFAAVYGDGGSIVFSGGNQYTIYDAKGNEVEKQGGPGGDVHHFSNFIESFRNDEPLTSEIKVAQESTMLCHLANISYRTGKTIDFDPSKNEITNSCDTTEKLWSRDYQKGWDPKV